MVLRHPLRPGPHGGRPPWPPFSAGYRLLDAGSNFDAPVQIAHQLARPHYVFIFAGFALVSLAIGTLLLDRRDTN